MTANGGANVPMKFFLPKALRPFFTPTPESAWRQGRRGNADMAHAAMRGGGGESGDVQQRAAADGDEIRVPVNVVPVNVRLDFTDDGRGVFGGFAAADKQRRTDQLQAGGVRGKIFFNLAFQFRQRLRERIFQDDQGFARAGVGQHVLQDRIVRRKDIFGEIDAKLPADLNGAFDDGHGFNLDARQFFARKNLAACPTPSPGIALAAARALSASWLRCPNDRLPT